MHEVYGVDIERPGCSLAHLACLAAQLGPRSRLFRAMDPACAWGDAEYIAAVQADALACLRYELGGCTGSPPRPLPRPGERRGGGVPRRANVSRERLDAILWAPRA